jgi:hypothetical protein
MSTNMRKKSFPLLKFETIFCVLFLKWQSAFANSVKLNVFKKHATKLYVKGLKRIKTISKKKDKKYSGNEINVVNKQPKQVVYRSV